MYVLPLQECASLADRLIQGQVTRAQEAEEMFVVRKELSQMRRRISELELQQPDGFNPVSPDTPVIEEEPTLEAKQDGNTEQQQQVCYVTW